MNAQRGTWNGDDVDMVPTTKARYFADTVKTIDNPGNELHLIEILELLGVCPAGFVDNYTAQIVSLESDASTYHVLPVGRGILDETERTMQAFREVRRARDDFYIELDRRRRARRR